MTRKIIYGVIGGAVLSAVGTLVGAVLGIKAAEKYNAKETEEE